MAGAPVPAPGKFSKRTDLPRTPGLADPSLQYGDVGRLEAAQRAVPIPKSAPQRRGQPLSGGRIPDFVLNQPTQRPGEPETTGLPMGPGAGPEVLSTYQAPDLREQVLLAVYHRTGNEKALAMLQQLRNERMQQQAPGAAGPTLNAFADTTQQPQMPQVSGASNFLPGLPGGDEQPEQPAATEETEPTQQLAPGTAPPEAPPTGQENA